MAAGCKYLVRGDYIIFFQTRIDGLLPFLSCVWHDCQGAVGKLRVHLHFWELFSEKFL